MEEVLKRYEAKFDELNVLKTQFATYKLAKEDAQQEFTDILIDAYVEGFVAAQQIIHGKSVVDPQKLRGTVQFSYNGQTIQQKFSDYYETGNTKDLSRLLDSEFHRVYNTAALDAAEQEQQNGKNILKQWLTVRDDKVRGTHEYIEGDMVPLDDVFVTYDGDYAQAPGEFQLAQNNANCRCILRFTAL